MPEIYFLTQLHILFFRPQFPLPVSVASAHLRKYGSCLSNREMRKMKLMTTYRQLVQEKAHKQKLSNNNNKVTEYHSIKVIPNFSECRLFFPLITLWQKESRGPIKKYYLIPVHTPGLLTEQWRCPRGKAKVFDHITKTSIIVHEH